MGTDREKREEATLQTLRAQRLGQKAFRSSGGEAQAATRYGLVPGVMGVDSCLFNSKCDLMWIACESTNKVCPSLGRCPCPFPVHPGPLGHAHAQTRASAVPDISSDVNAGMAPKAQENAGLSRIPKTFVLCSPYTVAHHSQPVAVAFLSPNDSGSYDTVLPGPGPDGRSGARRVDLTCLVSLHPDRRPSTPSGWETSG